MVHRIVKLLANAFTFAFSLTASPLPSSWLTAKTISSQTTESRVGVDDLGRSLASPECVSHNPRGVEMHREQETNAPKRQSARRSQRALKQMKDSVQPLLGEGASGAYLVGLALKNE